MKRHTINIPIETEEEAGAKPMGKGKSGKDEKPEMIEAEERGAETVEEPDSIAEVSEEAALDRLKRLQADFENYKRRSERERFEISERAQAALIERLLPALDDLDRAAESVEDPDGAVAKGFLLVREKLQRILTEAGLERIPSVGEDFDPNQHEALLTEPVEPERAGKVMQELVVGYLHRGRVLRPSRVKVGMESEGS